MVRLAIPNFFCFTRLNNKKYLCQQMPFDKKSRRSLLFFYVVRLYYFFFFMFPFVCFLFFNRTFNVFVSDYFLLFLLFVPVGFIILFALFNRFSDYTRALRRATLSRPPSWFSYTYKNVTLNFPPRHDSFPLLRQGYSNYGVASKVLKSRELFKGRVLNHVPYAPESFFDFKNLRSSSAFSYTDFGKQYGFKDGVISEYSLEWAFLTPSRYDVWINSDHDTKLEFELPRTPTFDEYERFRPSRDFYFRLDHFFKNFDINYLYFQSQRLNASSFKRFSPQRFFSYKASDFLFFDEVRDYRFLFQFELDRRRVLNWEARFPRQGFFPSQVVSLANLPLFFKHKKFFNGDLRWIRIVSFFCRQQKLHRFPFFQLQAVARSFFFKNKSLRKVGFLNLPSRRFVSEMRKRRFFDFLSYFYLDFYPTHLIHESGYVDFSVRPHPASDSYVDYYLVVWTFVLHYEHSIARSFPRERLKRERYRFPYYRRPFSSRRNPYSFTPSRAGPTKYRNTWLNLSKAKVRRRFLSFSFSPLSSFFRHPRRFLGKSAGYIPISCRTFAKLNHAPNIATLLQVCREKIFNLRSSASTTPLAPMFHQAYRVDPDFSIYSHALSFKSASLRSALEIFSSSATAALARKLYLFFSNFGFFGSPSFGFSKFYRVLGSLVSTSPLALLPSSVSDYYLLELYIYNFVYKFGRKPLCFEILRIFFSSKLRIASLGSLSSFTLRKTFYATPLVSFVNSMSKNFFFSPCADKPDDRGYKELEPYSIASTRAFHSGWYRSPFWEKNASDFFFDRFAKEVEVNRIGVRYFDSFLNVEDSRSFLKSQYAYSKRFLESNLSVIGDGRSSEFKYDPKYFSKFRRFYTRKLLKRDWFYLYRLWRSNYQAEEDKRVYSHSSGGLGGIPPYRTNDVLNPRFGTASPAENDLKYFDPYEDYLIDYNSYNFKELPSLDDFNSVFSTEARTSPFSDHVPVFFKKGFSFLPNFDDSVSKLFAFLPNTGANTYTRIYSVLQRFMFFDRFRRVTGFLPSTFFRAQRVFKNFSKPRYQSTLPRFLIPAHPVSHRVFTRRMSLFFDPSGVFNGKDWTIYSLDKELYEAVLTPFVKNIQAGYGGQSVTKAFSESQMENSLDSINLFSVDNSKSFFDIPYENRFVITWKELFRYATGGVGGNGLFFSFYLRHRPFSGPQSFFETAKKSLSATFFLSNLPPFTPSRLDLEAFTKLKKLYPALATWTFSRFYVERQKTYSQIMRPTLLHFKACRFGNFSHWYTRRTNAVSESGGDFPFFFKNFLFERQVERKSFLYYEFEEGLEMGFIEDGTEGDFFFSLFGNEDDDELAFWTPDLYKRYTSSRSLAERWDYKRWDEEEATFYAEDWRMDAELRNSDRWLFAWRFFNFF